MNKYFLTSLLTLSSLPVIGQQQSPNAKFRVQLTPGKELTLTYKGMKGWQKVLSLSTLSNQSGQEETNHAVNYTMLLGKRSHCSNIYNETKYWAVGGKDTLTVRLYNDGIAWRSTAAGGDYDISTSEAQHDWLLEWSDSYENFFPCDREVKGGKRFGYPALFEYSSGTFALLSESDMQSDEAASSLYGTDTRRDFHISADGQETGGWQTLIVGSLSDVVESTLITDNSSPCRLDDTSWIRPGVAAWVYWAYNHGSNDYDIISRYVDMAATMKLPYVLIDAEWDEMKGGYTVEDAVRYAVARGVDPIIWYNSSVGWINGAPGPKFRLNDPEKRESEFAWCEKIGVKGVKIDFFSGDTHLNVEYMIALLESAARHHLQVNFHGATIPRGWQRTYPNLVSTEGVYGAEWYNNRPTLTDRAASHNATLPFIRNVVGSMDYTPCAFSDSQHPHITTHAHELALTALYESGIQHLADRPESFLKQPQAVQDYLSMLPTAWDETLLLSGYPGKSVVMARRCGKVWYIAGINGLDEVQTLSFSLARLKELGSDIVMFNDAETALAHKLPAENPAPWLISHPKQVPSQVSCMPRGGFLIVVK